MQLEWDALGIEHSLGLDDLVPALDGRPLGPGRLDSRVFLFGLDSGLSHPGSKLCLEDLFEETAALLVVLLEGVDLLLENVPLVDFVVLFGVDYGLVIDRWSLLAVVSPQVGVYE